MDFSNEQGGGIYVPHPKPKNNTSSDPQHSSSQPQMKVLRAPGGKHILATPVVYYLEAADLPEKPRDEKKRAQKVQRARKVQIVLIQTKNTY